MSRRSFSPLGNKSSPSPYNYKWLSVVLTCIVLITLSTPSSLQAQSSLELVFKDGFETCEGEACIDPYLLDCVAKNYPCTLGEAEPEVLTRSFDLLKSLWDIRAAGSMADVVAHLELQPDVVAIYHSIYSIIFRVDGMSPAVFIDGTATEPTPIAQTLTGQKQNMHTHLSEPGDRLTAVGEDHTGDGIIDQRDIKRALVMAPLEWEFAPHDDSEYVAELLNLTRGYAGNVVFKRNLTQDEQNITLLDWLQLGSYDVISILTHGTRECRTLPGGEDCLVEIVSGIRIDFANPEPGILEPIGAWPVEIFDTERTQALNSLGVSFSADFFRNFYRGTLNNRLVALSACETGNTTGGLLAATMGSNNFVMTGWSESIGSATASNVAIAMFEELSMGLNTDEVYQILSDQGLFPVTNTEGVQTELEMFAPDGKPVRIIELPRLMYDGSRMPDGINILDLVDGDVGDSIPDSLQLTVQVDGVTPQSINNFQVRYRVADQNVPGSYGLGNATKVDGFDYRYEVTHDVAPGFPLYGGDLTIEVIVDLPEGGDSRYTADVVLASCGFSAQISGDTFAEFNGPAQFKIESDGSLSFDLRSKGLINGDPETSIEATFKTGASTPTVPGTYTIQSASVGITSLSYSAFYVPAIDLTCPTCGGSTTLDSVVVDQSASGSASIRMVRVNPPPDGDDKPVVILDANFIAAFGSALNGSSPYVQCAIQY